MRGFMSGLLIGLLVGGGGVYLALEKPWPRGAGGAARVSDAGVAVSTTKPDKKRKQRPRGVTSPTEVPVLTAADKQLQWQGQAVALPERSLDMGGDVEGRPLSAAEINNVISAESRSLLACIEDARGNAPLETTVTLVLLVDGDGSVEKSRVRAPAYLFEHGFAACARKAAQGMRFPATGGYTVVTTPYDLY